MTGLPHTQGNQVISGNFQIEENLRETQEDLGRLKEFLSYKKTESNSGRLKKILRFKKFGIFFSAPRTRFS